MSVSKRLAFAAVSSLFASACSMNPYSDRIKVRIDMGGERSAPIEGRAYQPEPLTSALGLVQSGASISVAGSITPPANVDGFDCYAVNVSGPGLSGVWNPPSGSENLVCTYPAVTSEMFLSNSASVELDVLVGPSRVVQMIGVSTGTGCPAAGAKLADYMQQNPAGGTTYELRELGRTKIDLFADTTVEIKNTYNGPTGNQWPFQCRYLLDPRTIPGLALWFRGDTLSQGPATPISQWSDQSGSGLNLVPSFGGPLYQPGGFLGNPSAQFSGGDAFTAGDVLNPVFNSPGSRFTVFFAGYSNGNTTQMVLSKSDISFANRGFELGFFYNSGLHLHMTTQDSTASNPLTQFADPVIGPGQGVVGTFIFDATAAVNTDRQRIFLNGAEPTKSAIAAGSGIPGGTNSNPLIVGGGGPTGNTSPLNGQIAEILVYGNLISETDRQRVECYLGMKHNLPVQHDCR